MNRTLLLSAALAPLVLGGASIATQVVGAPARLRDLAASQDADYANHFQAFTGEGEPAALEDIVRAMADADAVLVGESHTDPVGHWIEAELVRQALAAAKVGDESGALRPVALSLEMFERDVQYIVDEYLQDLISEDQFKKSARAWEHYDTDYRPMVELAKEAGISVIAANAPRRYVNRVTRLGRDALNELPPSGRSFLPPLPYPQPSDEYREQWLSLMREMPMERRCEPPGAEPEEKPEEESPHAEPPPHMGAFMENGVHAQALWDASMAHAVTTFLEMNPGALVLHMVGGFHVERFTGIPEQIQYYRPGTRTLVVTMELADDFRSFDPEEHSGLGDFVILTDKSLDLDYERNCAEQDGG
jgi:uncharacterized iron-regulated protein